MKKILSIILCFILISTLVFLVSNLILKPNFENPLTIVNQEKVYVADKLIKVPKICQYPELPTGCESVSATMVLQHYGENVSAEEFVNNWLECRLVYFSVDGNFYGPNPNESFAGNPYTKSSYGCYANAIVKFINSNSNKCIAVAIEGRSLDQLCKEYIDNDKPLLIWATIDMTPSKEGTTWYFDDSGEEFTWISGEHCLVLIGYNDESYILNDPTTGETVLYERSLVEQRYTELGQQAVCIFRK